MSIRKNIDKLYLSKFEGAEVTPPEDAWKNIALKLPQKEEERRIIPLWIRLAGAAAILLLLVIPGISFFSTGPGPGIVHTPVTRQDIHREIKLSSASFTETMLKASMDLQQLMRSRGTGASEEMAERIPQDIPALVGTKEDATEEVVAPGMAKIASESNTPEAVESVSSGTGLARNASAQAEGKDTLITDKGISSGDYSEENAIAQQLSEDVSGNAKEFDGSTGNKMSISTRVAPVFYENIGGGSALGSGMRGGETSGEVSFSYGINVAYQVSERLKLRSGINKLDLSFSTPDVPVAAAMNSTYLVGEGDPTLMSRQVEGDLQQKMDFIEVPLEMEYRLLDNRIGLNLIAGGSTLLLNNNTMSMNTGSRITDLGQEENMERLNFSANMGLGLDYQLSKGLSLSLEPMFKLQLNSFSKDAGVRPYYLAIYSGIGFSF